MDRDKRVQLLNQVNLEYRRIANIRGQSPSDNQAIPLIGVDYMRKTAVYFAEFALLKGKVHATQRIIHLN